MPTAAETDLPVFEISRVFDAPRRTVFQVFTQAEHMAHWWGPKGWALDVLQLDLRPGGLFHYKMTMPDGKAAFGRFVYEEIVPIESVTIVSGFADENANPIRHPMSPTWPLEMWSRMTLEDLGNQTRMTVRARPHNASAVEIQTFADGFGSMKQGFGGTWDNLEAYLKTL
ncbi:MAG: SRPBCC domain-containing protein [Bryobacteraceae bacterium]